MAGVNVGKASPSHDSLRSSIFRLSLVHWQEVLRKFGLEFTRVRNRGDTDIKHAARLFINLDTDEWRMEREMAGSRETVAHNWGVTSLHAYLLENSIAQLNAQQRACLPPAGANDDPTGRLTVLAERNNR
jgi:hypothetical protein